MRGLKTLMNNKLGEMGFNTGGGVINWFPGHMAAATRAIRHRLKLSDLVIEVRDTRVRKNYFESCNQDCVSINAHSKSSVQKLLVLVEWKLKEVILREPTLLVMVVGVPNVGKSALINTIHQIASSRFPGKDQAGQSRALTWCNSRHCWIQGSVKDSVVGEERIAQYLLTVLNCRSTPLHWKHLNNRSIEGIQQKVEDKPEYNLKDLLPGKKSPPSKSDVHYVEDIVTRVQCALYTTV